jgi:hypothetical protein
MEQSNTNIQIDQSWVIKKSGCIQMAILKFVFASPIAVGVFLLFTQTSAIICKIGSGVLLGIVAWLFIMIVKDVSTLCKLISGKYKVKIMQVNYSAIEEPSFLCTFFVKECWCSTA